MNIDTNVAVTIILFGTQAILGLVSFSVRGALKNIESKHESRDKILSDLSKEVTDNTKEVSNRLTAIETTMKLASNERDAFFREVGILHKEDGSLRAYLDDLKTRVAALEQIARDSKHPPIHL